MAAPVLMATLAACSSMHQAPLTTTTSGGDVSFSSGGMWADSTGGMWMDNQGAWWNGGRSGTSMGVSSMNIRRFHNENIVAHLGAGDSLEVALSQIGVTRAQNSAVSAFAQRMVSEHLQHFQTGMQLASSNSIVPMGLPDDTAETRMTSHAISKLSSMPAGEEFDRAFMRHEVMMHQHMLNDLNLFRGQATDGALRLVKETTPIVQQHLDDARALAQQVGVTMNMNP
jgi:putative membrane protein